MDLLSISRLSPGLLCPCVDVTACPSQTLISLVFCGRRLRVSVCTLSWSPLSPLGVSSHVFNPPFLPPALSPSHTPTHGWQQAGDETDAFANLIHWFSEKRIPVVLGVRRPISFGLRTINITVSCAACSIHWSTGLCEVTSYHSGRRPVLHLTLTQVIIVCYNENKQCVLHISYRP